MSLMLEETNWESWPAVALSNDAMRVVILPELGGKIISMSSVTTGREWLWRNPYLPLRLPSEADLLASDSYAASFDSGGWDEVFPTVEPCRAEGAFWGDSKLTDHGQLWCQKWEVTQQSVKRGAAATVTTAVADQTLPFRFEKTLSLADGMGPLTMRYRLTNRTKWDMDYIWAAHPLLAIEPGMSIDLPDETRFFCPSGVIGRAIEQHAHFVWPEVPLKGGGMIDLSKIPDVEIPDVEIPDVEIPDVEIPDVDAGWVAKLFTDRLCEGWVAITDAGQVETLRFDFDPSETPHIGFWMNYGRWSGNGSPPYFNIGIEPTTSPCDRLNVATSHGTAKQLLGGQSRRWSLAISLRQEH